MVRVGRIILAGNFPSLNYADADAEEWKILDFSPSTSFPVQIMENYSEKFQPASFLRTK